MKHPLLAVVLTSLVLWPAPGAAADGQVCEDYQVQGVRPGMSPGDVWKVLDGRGEVQGTRNDPTGPVTVISYTRRQPPVDVEYDRAPIAKRHGAVTLVRSRLPLVDETALDDLRERFGAPTEGEAALDGGLAPGEVAIWIDPRCGVVVSVSRQRPEWWESGPDELAIEVRSTERAVADALITEAQVEVARPPPEVTLTLEHGAGDALAAGEDTPTRRDDSTASAGEATVDRAVPRRISSSYIAPVYPRLARELGVEGYVTLRLVIDRDGSVVDAEVLECSPARDDFENAALRAVKRWRYLPAMRDGEPVESELEVRIEFKQSRSAADELQGASPESDGVAGFSTRTTAEPNPPLRRRR